MANIKKSFNFRNGVQVDDDNLKVRATGLVGIGTTVPTEALDVRGNLVVSGVSSAATIQAGVLTVTTFNPTSIIGAGISVVSGVVTASSGIVTYYGDARFLQGLPTSQWEDVNTGFGVSSIYNTGGNVGIATSNPQFTLQVGGDVNSNKDGVGISSAGNIKISGIASASQFVGSFTGNVTGNVTGNLTGDVTGNTQGIHTGAVNLGDNEKATFGAGQDLEILHLNDESIIRETRAGVGATLAIQSDKLILKNKDGNEPYLEANYNGSVKIYHDFIPRFETSGIGATVYGQLDTTNLNVSGVSTFSDDLVLGVGATVGIKSTVFFDNGVEARFGGSTISPGLKISNDSSSTTITSADSVFLTATGSLNIGGVTNNSLQSNNNRLITGGGVEIIETDTTTAFLKHSGTEKLKTTDSGVYVSGIITATTELNSPLIGVGTDNPANDIQVRKSGNAEIQITSDTGMAGLSVGREASTGDANNAEFRYGGGAGAPYSTPQSLDIVNYGTHNFNYYLSASNPSGVVGDFHWQKGLNNTKLMTLTNTGRLGIGETQPDTALHVAGVCTVTSNSFVASNFEVGGNTTIGGDLTISGSLNVGSSLSADVTGDVTGNLDGNINSIGISTFSGQIGIGTDNPIPGIELDAHQVRGTFFAVGVGTTSPNSGVDFSDAGSATDRFLIPPKVTTTERNNLEDLVTGALVFNTTSSRLELYLGSSWVGIATVV